MEKIFEPEHDKANKITFAPNEDSDQPGQCDKSLRCPPEEG